MPIVGYSRVSGFSPTAIAGLKLWLKADAETYADGDPISTWTDRSGSGFDATASSTARPTFKTSVLDTKPVARFDGTNDAMGFASAPLAGAAAGTAFVVVAIDADPPPTDPKSSHPLQSWGTDSGAAHYPYINSIVYDDWGSTVRKTVGNPTPSLASWRIYCIQSAANLWRSFIDGGTPIFTTTTNTVAWAAVGGVTPPGIGGTAQTGYYMDGDIAEIIIYDSKLSDADLNKVGAYLVAKYPSLAWATV